MCPGMSINTAQPIRTCRERCCLFGTQNQNNTYASSQAIISNPRGNLEISRFCADYWLLDLINGDFSGIIFQVDNGYSTNKYVSEFRSPSKILSLSLNSILISNSTWPKKEKCSKWPKNDPGWISSCWATPPPGNSTWAGQLNMDTKNQKCTTWLENDSG